MPSLLKEALRDPLSYAERLLWIRSKAGALVPFHPNSVQKYVERVKAETRTRTGGRPGRFMILKYRQGGITTNEQAISFHTCATRPYQHAVTLAHSTDAVERIFEMVHLFYSKLPEQLRPHRKRENRRVFHFDRLGSQFYVGSAGAVAIGRGTTLQRVHGSEVAFWEGDVRNVMAGLLEAAAQGDIVLESTPNGSGNWFHETWKEASDGANEWTPIFLPWFVDTENVLSTADEEERQAIMSTLDDEEKGLAKKHSLTPEQIKWRRDRKRSLKILFAQEYPEDDVTCFIVSGQHFFDLSIARRLLQECPKPIETRDNGQITIWKKPQPGHRYVIGVDTSEGTPHGDFSCAGVVDVETTEQVAVLHGRLRPEVTAQKVAKLGLEYNKALIAVEANNHGHSTLNTLQNTLHYGNLYRHQDYAAYGSTPKLGWQTNEKTRPLLLDGLQLAMDESTFRVNDKDFLAEMFTFEDNGSGKYSAREGYHDDRIVAWGIAWQIRRYGRGAFVSTE